MFKVNLQVEKVQVFNRIDNDIGKSRTVSKRTDKAEITIWKEDSQVKSCGTLHYIDVATLPSQSYLFDCGSTELADSVKIQLPGTEYLNVAEVFVLTKTAPEFHATCSNSDTVSECGLAGLEEGDVLTALIFYGKDRFRFEFRDDASNAYVWFTPKDEPNKLSFNTVKAGHWGTPVSYPITLLKNEMREIKISVLKKSFKVTMCGVELPEFEQKPGHDLKLITKFKLTI